MVDKGIGDYFISDADDEALEDDDLLEPPVVIPVTPQAAAAPAPAAPTQPSPPAPAPASATTPAPQPAAPARPQAQARQASREEQLAQALDELMQQDPDIQAAALVSLDGFTMASALPQGMQPDRVGAMSAAILGLGERAAAELGRGHLSQVFIEGEGGYVLLVSAGDRAVLTVMADSGAKLGLVLYDMKVAAERIGRILG
ncbi:MAG: roadblock/LC7 domain-containing protein [Anaerosomatales bacterium]|nr:roadblock/LC7 domain-containing protein [Anaerosomatales bacterium]